MTERSRTVRVLRRAAAPPRIVLLWVIVLICVAIGMYAAAPWILPARVYEGPMVQMATETGVTLVWFTTRPVACSVVVTTDGQARTVEATATGKRNVARIEGLAPGHSYLYRIQTEQRFLTDPLEFVTNRTADQRCTFYVFGDSGRATRAQFDLAAEMLRTQPQPDFLLHTGDLVYTDGARKRYAERFFVPYRHQLARVGFWPCLGNHDMGASDSAGPTGNDVALAAGYREVFELPGNGPPGVPPGFHYWFDYGACRIAVIDSDADEATLRDKVAPWLRDVLADPAPRWRFVSFHHPPYTGGKHRPCERVQHTLVPVIEAAGVDIVFNGHDHNYQRMRPMRGGAAVENGPGVVYIVTGAGGASLYEPAADRPRPDYVAAMDYKDYSFTQVVVDGNDLTLRQIAAGGRAVDEYRLRKAPTTTNAAATAPAEMSAASEPAARP